MDDMYAHWYLVRTKQHKEFLVRHILSARAGDTFLPLLRTRRVRGDAMIETIQPLFPCYIFAFFNPENQYHAIQRTPGVIGVVRAGDGPAKVDTSIVEEIKRRTTDDIVDLPGRQLRPGERVRMVGGPLRGLTAVFERYLSGGERVALLVNLVGGSDIRVTMPSLSVIPYRTIADC